MAEEPARRDAAVPEGADADADADAHPLAVRIGASRCLQLTRRLRMAFFYQTFGLTARSPHLASVRRRLP